MISSAISSAEASKIEGALRAILASEARRSRAARMKRIRCVIFRVTQIEMATIAGVEQPTVSRWEKGTNEPSLTNIESIRAEAIRRGLPWNDEFFFTTGERAA